MKFLSQQDTALLIIDVQTKLFPFIKDEKELLETLTCAIKAFQLLGMPIFASEQYPEGLGPTIPEIKDLLPSHQIFRKNRFSAAKETQIKGVEIKNWVLVGIETHICVLQTAKELSLAEKDVTVLFDGTSARSQIAKNIAIEEMTHQNIRISSCETILYEILRGSSHPHFKEILNFVKNRCVF